MTPTKDVDLEVINFVTSEVFPRLNKPKREKSIHPHELLLQEDLFYSDHTSNTLEFVFQRLLISSSKDNKEFMRNLNLNIKRLYCEHTNPLSNEPFIKIKDNNQGENIEQIVHKYLEVEQRSVNSYCSLHGQNMDQLITRTYYS